MSNKTDLQALNANYEALIEELRGKAVGGGSGGGVETCTVSLAAPIDFELEQLVYCDGSSIIDYNFGNHPYSPFEITVVKNSILFMIISLGNIVNVMGGAEMITNGDGNVVIGVTGDCSLAVDVDIH